MVEISKKMVAMPAKLSTLALAESTIPSRSEGAQTMTREAQLGELLMQYEERRQHGEAIAAADVCRDCPELVPELEKRIDALNQLGPVLAVTPLPNTPTA